MGAPRWWEPPAAPSSSVVSQKAGRSLENETLMPGKHEKHSARTQGEVAPQSSDPQFLFENRIMNDFKAYASSYAAIRPIRLSVTGKSTIFAKISPKNQEI